MVTYALFFAASLLAVAFLALAAAAAAKSMTLRPLYHPQDMHRAWLRRSAPQLAHFDIRAAESAWCERLLPRWLLVARIRFTMGNSIT